MRRTLAERIAHAEAAERSFWAAQRWLDIANDLRGNGSGDTPEPR